MKLERVARKISRMPVSRSFYSRPVPGTMFAFLPTDSASEVLSLVYSPEMTLPITGSMLGFLSGDLTFPLRYSPFSSGIVAMMGHRLLAIGQRVCTVLLLLLLTIDGASRLLLRSERTESTAEIWCKVNHWRVQGRESIEAARCLARCLRLANLELSYELTRSFFRQESHQLETST
jgi:hypothetical protein